MRNFRHIDLTWTRLLAFALAVVVLGMGPGLIGAERAEAQTVSVSSPQIDDARADFAALELQVEGLRDQRQRLGSRYDRLTQEIAAQKRARTGAALLGDIDLNNKLGEARKLADRLNGLQKQLRARERALETARARLVAAFDAQIVALEGEIIDAEDETSRDMAIAAINTVKRDRHGYVGRTRATPDLKLAELPSLGDVPVDDPEEALAQAAELDDTRVRIDGRIDSLQGEIDALERERRLRRKARDFKDRESFFDDSNASSRRVATSGGGSRTPLGTDGQGRGAQGDDVANDAEAEPTDDGAFEETPDAAPPEFDSDEPGAPSDPDALGAPEPETDSDVNDRNDGFAAGGEDAETVLPEALPGVELPGDPFNSGSVVIKGDVEDLGVAGDSALGGSGSLNGRLQTLKRQKEALEKKSKELEDRAKTLKQRANEF